MESTLRPVAPDRIRPAWPWLLLPLVVSAALRDLWAPDEPRYAMVARELFERGDFLVMHLCGAVYPDKPPLLFWLAGLLGWVSDWSVPAMRIVSLAATAGTALLTARLARRWWDAANASWAPALLLSTAMLTEIGGRLQIDPLLCVLVLGAIVAASEPAADRRTASRNVWLAGALAGLAMLAKGPVALVVIVLVLGSWRLLEPRTGGARAARASVAGAVALTLALPLAWVLAASLAQPGLARELLFGQHLERVVEEVPRHGGPLWKHLTRMPLLLLPWTIPVGLGLADATRAWRARRAGADFDRGILLAAAWFLTLFLFFSLIPPKRDLYLLPAYPAAALLAARAIRVRLATGGSLGAVVVSSAAVLGLMGLASAALGPVALARPIAGLDRGALELGLRGALAGLPLMAGALWVIRARRAPGPSAALGRVLWVWSLGLASAGLALLPVVDRAKSARDFAALVAARPERPTEIPCVGVQPEGYRFYGAIPTVRSSDPGRWLAREGREFLALVSERRWPGLGGRERYRVLAETRVGSRRVFLLGADPALAARQAQVQSGAAAGRGLDPDLATLGVDRAAGEGQSQAVADAPPVEGR